MNARTGQLLYLARRDVERVEMPMGRIIERVEAVFAEKGAGRTEMPPKPGIHPLPDAFIHAMPAYVPAMQAAGMKWVSGYPANQQAGLPYISGLLILNDPQTGIPACVMDCTWITAQRTAAASAVAAKYLGNPDARTLAIIGCGVQGRSHLEALRLVLANLTHVRAYDIAPEVSAEYCAMARAGGFEANVASNVREAVEGADAIVTSGPILKQPDPPLAAQWVKPGAFISAVDFDSYVQPAAFERADLLFTDDLAQFHYYRRAGYFQHTPEPQGDLGQLVTGAVAGRTNPEQIAIAVNLGVALEDMAVAIEIHRRAMELGIGTPLEL
jgi:ornithine cyclodeaminase/alanine dehydrogenase-like protein (mu-crystallin family)